MVRFALHAAVRQALGTLRVPQPGESLLVGLSGGPDSTALLDGLLAASRPGGFRVVAAHLDHGLRPGSAEDARFCEALCRRLGVRLRTARADVRARARREGGGLEEAARLERYGFFRKVMREEGCGLVAVAHTRDDQAETLLLRLLRGSGSAGLGAMRPRRGDVVRPLLAVTRAQVLDHLEARGLPFREDPSNADLAIPRNRVRHELIPYLESRFNPRLREALARTAGLLGDDATVLRGLGARLAADARRAEGGWLLPLAPLSSAPRAAARAALRQVLAAAGGLRGVSRVHVERLLRLACSAAPSGRRLALPGRREAEFRFDELWIGPRPEPALDYAFELPVPGRVTLPDGSCLAASAGTDGSRGGDLVAAPGDLVVRRRLPGDRIRAHAREMSLKRYLMERRVPVSRRDRAPVVACGSRVVWVAGLPAEPAPPSGPLVRLELLPAKPERAVAGRRVEIDEDAAVGTGAPSGAQTPGLGAPKGVPFLERPQGGPPSRLRGIDSRAGGTSSTGPTEDAEPRRVSGAAR